MRVSKYLLPTLKETPKGAELESHRLMIRAGMIRSASAGIYSYLPLGWQVLRKIEGIIREEMDAIGGQELLMPVVHPAELWQETGRFFELGPELVRFKDRTGRDLVLGMTHEEIITDIVRREVNSYRQLPLMFYQIQTKFRDEPRPRGGLIRMREFTMKDAYSFHASGEDLDDYYPKVCQAYVRIFHRCGLEVLVVEADVGMMGGTASHEFVSATEVGEDSIILCTKCDYAANRQVAQMVKEVEVEPLRPQDGTEADEEMLPLEEVATPGCYTIEAVANYLGVPKSRTAKAVFYHSKGELIFTVIRGDLEISETKLANALLAADLRPATEEEILASGAVPGYASPVGLDQVRIVLDDSIPASHNLVAGANKEGYHLKNVNYGRDFTAELVTDIATAQEGGTCTRCGGKLKLIRGIEVGNTFKLGVKYSEAMGATFLNKDGAALPMAMGCYGIGTGRLMAAAIEQHHDERGISWPLSIAPFQVLILVLNSDEVEQMKLGEEFYGRLKDEKIEVLFDDREESPGVKFKDAELIGIPLLAVIGPRGMDREVVELQQREDGKKLEVGFREDLNEVIKAIKHELGSLKA